MIGFNKPPFAGKEFDYMKQAVLADKICGDGGFTKHCNNWIEEKTGCKKALLTTSGTHALEMAAFLCDLKQGDEVILPSYTFSSTANAFVLAGASLVFVDIDPKTMNISPAAIEAAITLKTKVICVVHYAGVSCCMDSIMAIADAHKLLVVEDAAQGVSSFYKGKPLGSIGDFGCFSFHETKNYSMGEGGALLINNRSADFSKYIERSEILREKGTDRSKFFRGQVDKYSWRDYGSSYLPSDLNAAYLWAQLEISENINSDRLASWQRYYDGLKPLFDKGLIELPYIPDDCIHNAHMFYIKLKNLDQRTELISFLKSRDIQAVFHYVPLHCAPAGIKFGRFCGEDVYTTKESERLVRLPLHYNFSQKACDTVIKEVENFFK